MFYFDVQFAYHFILYSQLAEAASSVGERTTTSGSAATSTAIVPYVPQEPYTFIGTMPAGFHPPYRPSSPINEEETMPEDAFDMVAVEDDAVPQGSEYIFDENMIVDYSDRYGTERNETERKKSLLIGTSTTVRGQTWVVRGDIPFDATVDDDYPEQGLRSNSVDCVSLPKRFRTRDEVLLGIRSSPRTPKSAVRDETKAVHATFMSLFPVNWKQSLKRLNAAILKDPSSKTRTKTKEVSENEYFVFIGILLLAAVQSTGGVEGLYKNKQTKGIVDRKEASEYMTQTRFKYIKTHWVEQFELDLTEDQKEENKWWRMGYLIQGFNDNRSKSVAASRVLTLDESMSTSDREDRKPTEYKLHYKETRRFRN